MMIKFTPPVVVDAGYGKSSFHRTFWEWMSKCGTSLGSFSTDSCVDRIMPQLQKLLAELEAWTARFPAEGLRSGNEDKQYDLSLGIAVQLRNIMKRGTAFRVAATRVTKGDD